MIACDSCGNSGRVLKVGGLFRSAVVSSVLSFSCTCACVHVDNTHSHTHTHTHTHAYKHTHTHSCIHTWSYIHIGTCTHGVLCIHTYLYTHVHTWIYICTCMHTHAHTHIEEGGGGSGLLDKLKRTLTRRENDEPDFSSFVTFRQPLEDCPVSPENKVLMSLP